MMKGSAPLGDRFRHARARRPTWPSVARLLVYAPWYWEPRNLSDDIQYFDYVCPDIEKAQAIADRFVMPRTEPEAIFGWPMPSDEALAKCGGHIV